VILAKKKNGRSRRADLTLTFTRLYVIDILSHIGDKHLVFGDELIHRGDRFLVDLGFDSGNHVSYAVQASTDL